MADNDSDIGAFFAGFVIGGLVGAAAALVLAPQSGEETRAQIRQKGIELRDQTVETAEETRRHLARPRPSPWGSAARSSWKSSGAASRPPSSPEGSPPKKSPPAKKRPPANFAPVRNETSSFGRTFSIDSSPEP
jgi:hypothetical protein